MSKTLSPGNILDTLSDLIKELQPSEVLDQANSDYKYHSSTFAAQEEKHPFVVFAPESIRSLSRIVSALYTSGLDFDIRGHGFKFKSGDVVLSMIKFRDFSYDTEKKLVSVGAGLTWTEVCEKMEREDPGHTTLVARTANVGVGGSIMLGGFSWMSSELGCISDPANFVDAEVVKHDGSIVMASNEPELMWALRGGGGGFGVVTKVVLQAHPYTTKIWSGNIVLPRSELPRVGRGLVDYMEHNPDPAVNAFLYVLRSRLRETTRGEGEEKEAYASGDKLIISVYDAHGEEHGRNAFRFALESPGAIDNTIVTNVHGVVKVQANATEVHGKMKTVFQSIALAHFDYAALIRAVEWFDGLQSYGGSIAQSSYLIFEFKSLGPIRGGTTKDCAYYRPADLKHILLLGAGCDANAPAAEWKLARQLTIEAPRTILGDEAKLYITPPGVEDFNDLNLTYGENLEKLVQIRRRYDPEGRFKGLVPAA